MSDEGTDQMANANGAASLTPLTFAGQGQTVSIGKIRGNDELLRHLTELGFVVGADVRVVADQNGNLIVEVKGTRVAINRATAGRILVH